MELPSRQDFEAFQASHGAAITDLASQITNQANINAVINGVPGAQQNDQARKARASQLYNEMQQYHDRLRSIVRMVEQEHITVAKTVRHLKAKVSKVDHELHEKNELAELRKEQAEEVKKHRFDANYHSSLLGLWKPLHSSTRSVLYTVSVVLGLIAVASIVFLTMTHGQRSSPAKSGSSSSSSNLNTRGSGHLFEPQTSAFNDMNNYGRVAGGSMKLRPKK